MYAAPTAVGDAYMRPAGVGGAMNARGSSGTPTPTVGADSISARGVCGGAGCRGGMNPSLTIHLFTANKFAKCRAMRYNILICESAAILREGGGYGTAGTTAYEAGRHRRARHLRERRLRLRGVRGGRGRHRCGRRRQRRRGGQRHERDRLRPHGQPPQLRRAVPRRDDRSAPARGPHRHFKLPVQRRAALHRAVHRQENRGKIRR